MTHTSYATGPLLATKLRAPTLANAIVERLRLRALLDNGQRHRLTLLSAPPGYGKTTLVADWLRHTAAAHPNKTPRSVGWVTLTPEDDQPAVFWSYIAAALDTAAPQGAPVFSALLPAVPQQSSQALLVPLLNALSALPEPLALIIDNYQHITSPEIHQSFAFLIEHLPEQVRVILLTNHDPALPLPRWRARGLVFEIRAEQLRCTLEEASAFFATSEIPLSADDLCGIVQRAEGWFAGLRLIGVASRQGRDSDLGMADLEHLHHYVLDYFFYEVIVHQPTAVRMFLLRTSALDEMNAAVCDALLHGLEEEPPESDLMLRHLERLNLFIVALDGRQERYRYHTLFRQVLRHLLAQDDPQMSDVLSQRASAWYEAQLPPEVVRSRHALKTIPTIRRAFALPEPAAAPSEREIGGAATIPPAPPVSTTPAVQSDPAVQVLSGREQEVLKLIAEGASNCEIADALVLSLHTVKRHASNILAKLNAANRTQAVAHARVHGVLATGASQSRPSFG